MGGTILGKGNTQFNIEFNFAADPEALLRVFKDFKMINLIPWEASPEFVIPLEDYEELQNPAHPKAKFLAGVHADQMKRLRKIMICDGFTPIVAIDSTVCDSIEELQAKVYTQGDAAGQISYAWPKYTSHYNKKKVNCRVYHDFDIKKTMKILLKSLK